MVPIPARKTLVKIEDNIDFQSAYYIDGYLSEAISCDVGNGHSNFFAVLVDLLTGQSSIYYFEESPFTAIDFSEAVSIVKSQKDDLKKEKKLMPFDLEKAMDDNGLCWVNIALSDPREGKILHTKMVGLYSILVVVDNSYVYRFSPDGVCATNDYTLSNVPNTFDVWVTVYRDRANEIHSTTHQNAEIRAAFLGRASAGKFTVLSSRYIQMVEGTLDG